MRASGLVLIILGLLAFCVGWFGPTLAQTFQVTSWSDNFDDGIINTVKWNVMKPATGVDVREENGRLRLLWTGGTGSLGLVSTETINLDSSNVKIDIVTMDTGEAWLFIMTGTVWPYDYYAIVKQKLTGNRLICRKCVAGVETIPKETTFISTTGTLELRVTSAGQIEWYDRATLIYSESYALAVKSLWIRFGGYWGNTLSNTVELDNFVYTPPPAPTGNLNVRGVFDALPVDITNVYYKDPNGVTSTPMSVPAAGYTWTGLSALGVYTVYGTYQGTANSTTVTVSEGQTSYAILDFGVTPPPQTGNLNVQGYYDTQEVAMTDVYYQGPPGTSAHISVPASGYTWADLIVGSYTVYGTYQGATKTTTVTVASGQTASALLNFGQPPQTGNLNVKGYYDGQAVAMTNVYYIISSTTSTPMSVPATGYTWNGLVVGTYTVYGVYQGITGMTMASVSAGQTAYAILDFGGPLPDVDPLQWIKDLLNDSLVRSGMMLGGAGMVGLGFIVLIFPKKKIVPVELR